jgi:hypothetical protein
LKFGISMLLAQTEAILKSLPDMVKANVVDALLLDTAQFYAELGAMQLGMQLAVAARIAAKQTGVVTSLDKLTADHLSILLNEVLNNSIYRDNAHQLQKAIAKVNGLSVAADLVEESLSPSYARR